MNNQPKKKKTFQPKSQSRTLNVVTFVYTSLYDFIKIPNNDKHTKLHVSIGSSTKTKNEICKIIFLLFFLCVDSRRSQLTSLLNKFKK